MRVTTLNMNMVYKELLPDIKKTRAQSLILHEYGFEGAQKIPGFVDNFIVVP